ncbi:hypothetical protein MPNT_60069 [Candidatus Methylacidithermus pantelleriae]|uniref:Uncharacterized protein n=1 Tax=Candidatus Methylacidithermus pantelleriae TaxID=2744239 RepID=A0A8J2BP88_9BACT|nr:hypothetical protein MPNT_60069 [Candidatus Methylacidithermus pantelleriae]
MFGANKKKKERAVWQVDAVLRVPPELGAGALVAGERLKRKGESGFMLPRGTRGFSSPISGESGFSFRNLVEP